MSLSLTPMSLRLSLSSLFIAAATHSVDALYTYFRQQFWGPTFSAMYPSSSLLRLQAVKSNSSQTNWLGRTKCLSNMPVRFYGARVLSQLRCTSQDYLVLFLSPRGDSCRTPELLFSLVCLPKCQLGQLEAVFSKRANLFSKSRYRSGDRRDAKGGCGE